jgi:hypothetical protein
MNVTRQSLRLGVMSARTGSTGAQVHLRNATLLVQFALNGQRASFVGVFELLHCVIVRRLQAVLVEEHAVVLIEVHNRVSVDVDATCCRIHALAVASNAGSTGRFACFLSDSASYLRAGSIDLLSTVIMPDDRQKPARDVMAIAWPITPVAVWKVRGSGSENHR